VYWWGELPDFFITILSDVLPVAVLLPVILIVRLFSVRFWVTSLQVVLVQNANI